MSFSILAPLILVVGIILVAVFLGVLAAIDRREEREQQDRIATELSPEQVRFIIEKHYAQRGLDMTNHEVVFVNNRFGFSGVRILKRHDK